MTIHRFFVNPSSIQDKQVIFSQETSRQLTKVLRLKAGDSIMVLDNTGYEYLIELESNFTGKIISKNVKNNEPKLKISLYQAMTTKDKFELILQKGTEVGICEFIPVATKRSLLGVKDFKSEKVERFNKIIKEATEQSERAIIPILYSPMKFEDAIMQAINDGSTIVAWEEEEHVSLKDIFSGLPSSGKISIFIGPEGGFDLSEIEFAQEQQALTVKLGPRILRTETAGLVMASLILFEKDS